MFLCILLAVIQFIIKKYSATLEKENKFQNKQFFKSSNFILGKKMLKVVMVTGVIFAIGLKKGYFLKHYFFNAQEQKTVLSETIQHLVLVQPTSSSLKIQNYPWFYLPKTLTGFAEDWVQHRTVPWRQMPTLWGEAVQMLQKHSWIVQAEIWSIQKVKCHFEKLNDNRPGHIYVKCPKFACINF